MGVRAACLAMFALAASIPAARAELAISANDGKQLLAGDPTPLTPDSISVIDLGRSPPRVLATLPVPASMIGPPASVAMGPREKFVLVTAAEKYDPANPGKPAADDKISVVDLSRPLHPRLLQTLEAGRGASGVSINPAGTLALVADRGEDAISIFTISGNHLTSAGRLSLEPKSAPTDVVFTPDGKKALVVAQGISKILEVSVDGVTLTPTGNDVAPGRQPYGAVVTPNGAYAINTNVGGSLDAGARKGPHTGSISMIDLVSHTLVASVDVGPVPEHVFLSPDGKFAAVVVANGAATVKSDPRYPGVLGILRIFRVGNGTLEDVAHADSCHWSQGATWSDDGRTLLLQCATEREIEVFHFDGRALTRDPAATMTFVSRPGAIATLHSR